MSCKTASRLRRLHKIFSLLAWWSKQLRWGSHMAQNCGWSLGIARGQGLHNKNLGPSVIQLEENGFCQPSEWVWKRILPHLSLQIKFSPANTLIAAWEDPEARTQLSYARNPHSQKLWDVNVCIVLSHQICDNWLFSDVKLIGFSKGNINRVFKKM